MHFENVVSIAASAETVWNVLTDLESWPEMTPSITSIERVDSGPLRVGSRVKIKQPSLPVTTWTVTEYVDGQRFVWEAKSPGARTTAVHAVLEAVGSTSLRLEIDQAGLMGGVVGVLFGGMTRKYLGSEAEGVKQRAEKHA